MSLDILNIIAYIVQFVLSTLFFAKNGMSRYNKFLYFWLMFLSFCILGYIDLKFFKVPSVYRTLVSVCYLFIINLVFLKDSMKRKLYLTIMFLVLSFLAESISVILYGIITRFDFANINNLTEPRILAVIFWCVLFDNFTLTFTIISKVIKKNIKRCLIFLLGILTWIQIFLLLGIFYNNKNMFQVNILYFGLVSAIGIIIGRILIYKTLIQFMNISENQKKLEIFKTENQYTYEYLKLATQNAKEIKIIKHELANQLQNAYAIFQRNEGNKELAFSILHNCEERLNNISNLLFCENTVINTVLSLKIRKAKEKGIRTNVIMDNLRNVTIDNMDLCSIFSNLLDNAIEALEHVPIDQRELTVKTNVKANCMIIKVENPFCGNIVKNCNGYYKTSKNDTGNHGLGLKLMKEITDKYHGEMDINVEDNYFKVTLILPSTENN